MPPTQKKAPAASGDKFVEKHPHLRQLFNKLREEKAALQKKSEPLREKREALVAKIQPMEAELRELDTSIAKIERPKMAELDMEIGALARSLGGRSMSQSVEPEETPVPE